MCTAKAPKQQTVKEKPVQYLSNPWIDGLGITGSQARGRNSLRTDLPGRVNTVPVNTYIPPGIGGYIPPRPPGGGGGSGHGDRPGTTPDRHTVMR